MQRFSRSSRLFPVRLLAALALAVPATAQLGIDWSPVGDPGNPAHPTLPSPQTAEGSIPYRFDIGTFEITCKQYVGFLNAIAPDDPNGLWTSQMETHALGGIRRTGTPGNYVYTVKGGFEDKPVVYTSFWDAARFANWLHNGMASGGQTVFTTEDGAYTLDPASVAANTVTRNPGARYALPTRPEWWKAGYYEASSQTWYVSPARSMTTMSGGAPADDDGNTGSLLRSTPVLEDVGSYGLSVGPHGAFDMGGNAYEWLDRITFNRREVAGGAWANGAAASNLNNGTNLQRVPAFEDAQSGFRLVRLTDSVRAVFRNAGTNPASFTCNLPIPGANWTPAVDLGTTGHALAAVVAFADPAEFLLSGGQTLLIGGAVAFDLPAQAGPLASWSVPVPTDVTFVGVPFSAQAVHVGSVTPFALSNAQDCRIGY